MQVDDLIVFLRLELMQHQFKAVPEYMDLIQVRIGRKYPCKCLFGEEMDLGIRHFLTQATDDRCGQHDIADGGKTDDQEFHETVLWEDLLRLQVVQVFVIGFLGKIKCHQGDGHDNDPRHHSAVPEVPLHLIVKQVFEQHVH